MPTIKILLVEDEKTFVQIVNETLRSKGFTVETAYDGAEGLKRFFEIHPDVLSRCHDATYGRLRNGPPHQEYRRPYPVLFLTAKSTPDDVFTGFELGANDYLKKPFAIQELIVRIKALMGKAYMTERLEPEQNEYTLGDYRFTPASKTLEYLPKGETANLPTAKPKSSAASAAPTEKLCPCRTSSSTSGATMTSSTPAASRSSSPASAVPSPKTPASASSMSAAPATN